jgi:hypothetical protein
MNEARFSKSVRSADWIKTEFNNQSAPNTFYTPSAQEIVPPPSVPNAPTSVTAVVGDTQAMVSWTAAVTNDGSSVTGYTVTSHPGNFTATSASTSATVTGLTNGISYNFTVVATNITGDSLPSSASNDIVPITIHTITASTGSNGTIFPSGAISVNNGNSQSFTITPNSRYFIDTITVDGVSVSATSPYLFTNVTTNHTISVVFTPFITSTFSPTAVGVSNTQAIISYTAPSIDACTIEVSESPTYTPLVHDVDPTLFTGSDQDSRTGSLGVGNVNRVIVIGKRSVEKGSDGNNYSRALQASTLYYYRVTCGHNNSTGTFTTASIPFGVGYGDPISTDPSTPGSYLYPTMQNTGTVADRLSSIVDPFTGALAKMFSLPGDLAGGTGFGMSSAGFGTACSPVPVAAYGGKIGYHCFLYGGSAPMLYWIASSDGEVRFLGRMRQPGGSGYNQFDCGGGTSLSAPFDQNDPNTWYCVGPNVANTDYVVAKGVYTGHANSGQDLDMTAFPFINPTPHTTWTTLVPAERGIAGLLKEFDPKFVTYSSVFGYRASDWANNKMYFYYWSPGQDGLGWVGVYDPYRTPAEQIAAFGNANGCLDNTPITGSTYAGQSGCIVGSTSSFAGGLGSGFRWGLLHSVDVTPASPMLSVTLNAIGQKSGGNSDYRATLTNSLSATPETCTMSNPGSNNISNWPDTTWTAGCSTITVSGDPALFGANPGGWPTSQPALPGDLVSVNGPDYIHHEVMRLLDKGVDGKTWYLQRQYYYRINNGTYCTGSQIAGCTNVYAYSSAASNGTMSMLPPSTYYNPNITGMQVWWDVANGAKSTDSTNTYTDSLPQGHPAYIYVSPYDRWTFTNATAISGQEPARFSNSTALPMYLPNFNGYPTAGGGVQFGLNLETHPSMSVSNPPNKATYEQVVDVHPYYGASTYVTADKVTLVSGQLYRIRGLNPSMVSTYKLIPYFAHSGTRAVRDVSGPDSLLATDSSTAFEWCLTLNAGECYPGSLVGDVYFNAPGVVNAYCTYEWSVMVNGQPITNDICLSQANPAVDGIELHSIANDPAGAKSRIISYGFGKPLGESIYANARTLPDGSWLFTSTQLGGIKLFKIPPMATNDGIDRTHYVPLPINIPKLVGASKAIVKFGYMEDGNPNQLFCTSRQDSCIANASSVGPTPFYFASENPTGLACGNGCTITVPAVPDRVIYTKVQYLDDSGNAIGDSAINVAIANSSFTTVTPSATTYAFTGPTSGNVNSVSANFTVTPDNLYTGTITPSDGGAGGTFTPTILTFSGSSAAQIFTYTPSTSGTKTISVSSNPILTDPANLTYTVASAQTFSSGGGGLTTGSGGTIPPPTTTTPLPVANSTTPPPTNISGCDNRTTGFSITTGESCINNIITTPPAGTPPPKGGEEPSPPGVGGVPAPSGGGGSYNFGTTTLKLGSKGNAVKELQKFLNKEFNIYLRVDGILGKNTVLSVKKWQKAHGLVADGLVGAKTKKLMNSLAR